MATILIAGLQPAIAGADSRLGSSEEEAATFSDAATEAGMAAGLVNQCRSDAAPIQSAFLRALDDGKVDPIDRQVLLERYRKAEASTISALAADGLFKRGRRPGLACLAHCGHPSYVHLM
jgi:hypothetical protein